jgi:hypothetical protein
MIVLGADTHKRSHTIAVVAAPTGELLGPGRAARVRHAVAMGAHARRRAGVGA